MSRILKVNRFLEYMLLLNIFGLKFSKPVKWKINSKLVSNISNPPKF